MDVYSDEKRIQVVDAVDKLGTYVSSMEWISFFLSHITFYSSGGSSIQDSL